MTPCKQSPWWPDRGGSPSGPPPLVLLHWPVPSDRRHPSWSSGGGREIDERQAVHDGEDEHRLQRVLPADQESAPPHARPGEPPDRPEAAAGERPRRLRAAGRGHQAPKEDQPPRRDTRDQGARHRGPRRSTTGWRPAALKPELTLMHRGTGSDAGFLCR